MQQKKVIHDRHTRLCHDDTRCVQRAAVLDRRSSVHLYLDYGRVVPAVSTQELGERAVAAPD